MSPNVQHVQELDATVSPKVALSYDILPAEDSALHFGRAWGSEDAAGHVVDNVAHLDATQSPKVALLLTQLCVEDVSHDIGVVRGEIFGNELNNQKRAHGIG